MKIMNKKVAYYSKRMWGNIDVTKKSKVPELQGLVVDVGPQLNIEDYGFKVGDRVIVDGTYVPVPRYDDRSKPRDLCVFPPHAIKCVLNVEISESSSLIIK